MPVPVRADEPCPCAWPRVSSTAHTLSCSFLLFFACCLSKSFRVCLMIGSSVKTTQGKRDLSLSEQWVFTSLTDSLPWNLHSDLLRGWKKTGLCPWLSLHSIYFGCTDRICQDYRISFVSWVQFRETAENADCGDRSLWRAVPCLARLVVLCCCKFLEQLAQLDMLYYLSCNI